MGSDMDSDFEHDELISNELVIIQQQLHEILSIRFGADLCDVDALLVVDDVIELIFGLRSLINKAAAKYPPSKCVYCGKFISEADYYLNKAVSHFWMDYTGEDHINHFHVECSDKHGGYRPS